MNMNLLEPITKENIHELRPGEWIWDNRNVYRSAHKLSLKEDLIEEPVGFRQVHVLNLNGFGQFQFKPFMLSSRNGANLYTWEFFKEGEFFKFKKTTETTVEKSDDTVSPEIAYRLYKNVAEFSKTQRIVMNEYMKLTDFLLDSLRELMDEKEENNNVRN